jgi:teichuronic acid biosynthesis glycosyltransferase TuaC
MKILTVTSLYPNAAMPTHAMFVENRLRRIVETGEIEAHVIAPVPWFPFSSPRFGRYSAFARTPRMEQRHGISITHPRFPVIPKFGTTLQPASYFLMLRREVRRLEEAGLEYDLIDAHYVYPDGVAAARFAKAVGKPIVVSGRGTDLNLIATLPGPGRQIREAFDSFDKLITVSKALSDQAVRLGMPVNRTVVLRNGVDTDLFQPADGTKWRNLAANASPLFASVGNLVPLKGHDLTIRALTAFESAHLIIAGVGPERQTLGALVDSLGLSERVHFLGAIPHDELASVYSAADLLILASEREGWPNVLLESMACGTPVVASGVGGIPEIVTTPEAGIIFECRSVSHISTAIEQLLAQNPDRQQVREHAIKFSWDDTVSKQIALYHNTVQASFARE